MDDESEVDDATREAEGVDAGHSHAADRLPTAEEASAADRALEGLAEDREEVAEHYEEMSDIGAHVKGEGSID